MSFFSLLGVSKGAKRVLAFPQISSFHPGSSTKLSSTEIEKMFLLRNDGSAQMVVVLTIKKMSYLLLGLFDGLVGPLDYFYL